jgi:hypothetical protein
MPRKPSPPLGHIAFTSDRKPYVVREDLPEEKSQLEMAICRKFVHALRRSHARVLSEPEKCAPRSVADCRSTDGQVQIDIQVTEVVDNVQASIHNDLRTYAERISLAIADVLPQFCGLSITLYGGEQTRYPPPGSADGRRIIGSFRENFLSGCDRLCGQKLGVLFMEKWVVEPGQWICGYYGHRFGLAESGRLPSLRFSQAYTSYPGEQAVLLPKTIQRKLDKRYARSRDARLILIAYQVLGAPCIESDIPDAFERSRSLLSKQVHPFDEVWYFFPMAGTGGCASPIWQCA